MEKLVDYLIVVHFLLQKQNAATYSCSKDTNQIARALKGWSRKKREQEQWHLLFTTRLSATKVYQIYSLQGNYLLR